MKKALCALALVTLAGCSGSPEPLIDHINVPDAKYNADLAACREQTKGSWIPFTGGSVSDCMKGRGYHVLMGGGGL